MKSLPAFIFAAALAAVGVTISVTTRAQTKNATSSADGDPVKIQAIANQIYQKFYNSMNHWHGQQDLAAAAHDRPVEMKRPVFSKAHGCVTAHFDVDKNLRQDLRVGVFTNTSGYDAWVRFSNDGPVNPKANGDTKVNPDGSPANPARGMAIKLLGIPGKKLLPGEETAQTQDFLMENNPAFFAATADEFLALLQDANFLPTHPEAAKVSSEISSAQMADPLQGIYWTPTPYDLGPNHQMKYSARPCATNEAKWTQMSGDNYLQVNMNDHLLNADVNGQPVCFDFYIQLFQNDTDTPLDNATKVWSEDIAPLIHAARLTINPHQKITDPSRVSRCESLSFNGWHAIAEHQPRGTINAVREIVYQKIAQSRMDFNNRNNHSMPVGEPTSLSDSQ